MAVRIAGVNIPDRKRVEIALTYVYGIGAVKAKEICKQLNIPVSKRAHELDETEIAQIRDFIEKNFKVEGDLRRDVSQNIRRKTEIGTYQGLRHRKGLPVRGQRTHTNARTRKGPRFAIAGKKKALK